MSFGTGFMSGFGNTSQAMMLKKLMLNGQGQQQDPMNPYMGQQSGYDPQAVENSMDQALGKNPAPMQPDTGGIQASAMNPQMQTQLPPPNLLAKLKAMMLGTGGAIPGGQMDWPSHPDFGARGF